MGSSGQIWLPAQASPAARNDCKGERNPSRPAPVAPTSRTDHAVPATGFSLIEVLVGGLEKRVVIGPVARAACNTDPNREAVGLACMRVGNTTTHALTEGHRIFGVDAVGNYNEFLTAKAIGKS